MKWIKNVIFFIFIGCLQRISGVIKALLPSVLSACLFCIKISRYFVSALTQTIYQSGHQYTVRPHVLIFHKISCMLVGDEIITMCWPCNRSLTTLYVVYWRSVCRYISLSLHCTRANASTRMSRWTNRYRKINLFDFIFSALSSHFDLDNCHLAYHC